VTFAAQVSAETLRHPPTLEQQLRQTDLGFLTDQVRQRGDATRGALLFYKSPAACVNCHASGEGDSPLGPNLAELNRDEVGQPQELSDRYLIESLLFPSKSIREGFETYSVLTVNGEIMTGLVVSRDESKVVLRTASNLQQETVIDANDIEAIRKNDQSMMPDGLVSSLAELRDFLDLAAYVLEVAAHGVERAKALKPSAEALAVKDDTVDLDHAGIIRGLRGRDFDENQTAEILIDRIEDDTDRIIVAVRGRVSVIVFCQNQEHCVRVAEELRARGESAEYIISGNSRHQGVKTAERDEIYRRFRDGEIRFLIGCDVLTTGFNARNVDALIMARATTSRALYIQMLGRGTRTYPGKTDCLVCDFVGNVATHGPYDVELTPQMARECAGQWKNCPRCGEQNHRSEPYCTECDHRFHGLTDEDFAAQNEIKALGTITRKGLSVSELPHHVIADREVFSYERGGKQILGVKYFTDSRQELVSFHVVNGAGRKFGQQWWRRFTTEPMPTDRHEAARIAQTFPVPDGVIEAAGDDPRYPSYFETFKRLLPWRRKGGQR